MATDALSAFLRYDPRLLEDAVYLVVRTRREPAFHPRRERLYDIANPEQRDQAFQKFYAGWFKRLRLTQPIEQAVTEQWSIFGATRNGTVARVSHPKDERAELFVASEGEDGNELPRRSVGIFLRPEAFLDPDTLLAFLRHELLHIADMLDPDFAYEPVLPRSDGPAHERLLRDRYRTLWDTTIDGRMVRRGWRDPTLRTQSMNAFMRVFSMLGEAAPLAFGRFFDMEKHTHAELLRFAQNPGVQLAPQPGGRCPLCCFSTYVFEPDPEKLPGKLILRIRQDFPNWHAAHGLCPQCADLYRTRVLRD